MNEFKLSVTYKTNAELSEREVIMLLQEQWEQTGAFEVGDQLIVTSVEQVRDNK